MSGTNSTDFGFAPGKTQNKLSEVPVFVDAADLLLEQRKNIDVASGKGILLLADGSRFEGILFGAPIQDEGELVFTTGMTGFQESLTDPSFAGQVLTFTYPLIGNYGVHSKSSESAKVWPRGVVCRHAIKEPDHRDSIANIHKFLAVHGTPGIQEVDTRSITRRVREFGTLLCIFGPIEQEKEMKERLEVMTAPDLEDLVDLVSIDSPVIINQGAIDENGGKLPRLAVLDCGIKYNILRQLCLRFEVVWCPPDITFEQLIQKWKIDALFCSNGPGDPAHSGKATMARNTLASGISAGIPTMGICLGHQLLGLGAGLVTYKMLYGHRGANQPVIDLVDGTVSITSQNHGFAVSDPVHGMLAAHPSGANSGVGKNILDAEVTVRYVNSNDRTVEGLDVIGKPAFSVQFHPEACPGPHDAAPLFDRFSELVEKLK